MGISILNFAEAFLKDDITQRSLRKHNVKNNFSLCVLRGFAGGLVI